MWNHHKHQTWSWQHDFMTRSGSIEPTPGKFDSEILPPLKWKTVWFNSLCDADSFLAWCWHAVSHRNRWINFNWLTEWIDMLHWHFLLPWCWTQAYQYIDHFLLVDWYEWKRPARNEWQIMPAWVTADKPSACFWHSGIVLISVADIKWQKNASHVLYLHKTVNVSSGSPTSRAMWCKELVQ